MHSLLVKASECLEAGANSERIGFYYMAGMRYAQASALIDAFRGMLNAGEVDPTEEDQQAFVEIHDAILFRIRTARSKTSNGHGQAKLSGSGSKDTLSSALDTLASELERVR